MSATIELARDLIRNPSVTPADAGCQKLIAARLDKLGFQSTSLPFGDVSNLWSVIGNSGPLFVFAGHTDVVPPGPLDNWTYPPFEAHVSDGMLYGRGAADMKSSVAAMVIAVERVLADNPLNGRIGFLLTSDEEGPAIDGTVKVVDYLNNNGIGIDWCVVGEPTSTDKIGDVIKNGRRGSLNGNLTVKGKQGHVAYPHLADNPIHTAAVAIQELVEQRWDNGNEFFDPTTFQISNINSGTGVENVVPGVLSLRFNFRYSTEVTDSTLKQRVVSILDKHSLNYDLTWRTSGLPFITGRGALVDATAEAIETCCGLTTELSTSGGTSDGRFIAPTGAEVLELGPINATIHQVDECVSCNDLDTLTDIYAHLLRTLLVK